MSVPPSDRLTHIDERGRAVMVDVTHKAVTERLARASATVAGLADALRFVEEHPEVLNEARMAGVSAAKSTSELIPLCHPLALDSTVIDFVIRSQAIDVRATTGTIGQTGVEMEALVACATAALSLVARLRTTDPGASIESLGLEEKRGGRSGLWVRDQVTGEDSSASP